MKADRGVQFRRKTAQDRDSCVALVLDVHRVDGYPGHLPTDIEGFVMAACEDAAWVAELDGRIVGHVAVHHAEGDPVTPVAQRVTGLAPDQLAVLARLMVSPHARRLGIARRLLELASDHADARGQTLVLDVVQTFAPAIALYESLGWNRLEPLRLDLGTAVLDLFVFLGPSHRRPRPQRPGPATAP